jgi:serine/threonine-protein kinase RsbW
MHLHFAVCLPREAETVALIRAAITNTLTLFGVAEDCVEDVRLAVSEACTNVISHADSDDEYEVEVHVDGHVCAVNVRDSGNGFDAAALRGMMPDPLSSRGRGVAIMKALMDRVHMTSSPEDGTIVHLTRTLTLRDDAAIGRLRPR